MSQLTKELIQKYISNPKVILEFGSYDGMDAIRYKNYFSKAFIYVMEADPTMFEKVKKNINNKEEIYIFHYAISNKTGIIDFYESKFIKDISGKKSGDPSFAGSLYRVLDSAIENQDFQVFSEIPIKVPTITIEDFCKQQKITQIDFMHIDVEGSLKEVLYGFGKFRPTLIFAETSGFGMYLGANTQKEYHQMFDKLGYVIVNYMNENTLYLYKKE